MLQSTKQNRNNSIGWKYRPKLIKQQREIYILLLSLLLIEFIFALSFDNLFVFSQKIILMIICALCIFLGLRERFVLNPYFCFVITPFSLMVYDHTINTRFLAELDEKVYIIAVCSFIIFIWGTHYMTEKINIRKNGTSLEQLKKRFDPPRMALKKIYSFHRKENDRDISLSKSIVIGQKSSQNMSKSIFLKRHLKFSFNNIYKNFEFKAICAKYGIIFTAIWFLFQIAKYLFHLSVPFTALVFQMNYIGIAFLLKSKKKYSYIIVAVISSYLLMSNFRKTAFLYIFLLVFITMLNSKKISRRSMFFGVIACLASAAFLMSFAYPLKIYHSENGSFKGLLNDGFGGLIKIMEKKSKGYGNPGDSAFLLRPYLSMTTEWTNLNYVLRTQPDLTYGMWFLRPIFNILQINTEKMTVYKLNPKSDYYNTFGFLTIQVKDFGYAGAILLTFFEGLLAGWSYKRYREDQNNLFEVIRYTFVTRAVLEMFFSNHFLMGGIHIIYLLTFMLIQIIKRTNRKFYMNLIA